MTGRDSAGSPFIRYSKFLRSGEANKFRWYFPKDETVVVKDLVSCTLDRRHRVVTGVTGSQQCELSAH